MSYDAASFKAGFALGRMLWRPPAYPEGDTGLGWSADPAYLVYDAGQYLGTQEGRNWYKAYDGWAVCCYLINDNNPSGTSIHSTIALISSEYEYAVKNGYTTRVPHTTFTYKGLTWYGCWDYGFYYVTGYSPLMTVDARGVGSDGADIGRYILDAANVRVYRTSGDNP